MLCILTNSRISRQKREVNFALGRSISPYRSSIVFASCLQSFAQYAQTLRFLREKQAVVFLSVIFTSFKCVFTVWLELILSETPERNQTKEASPPPLATTRHPAKKFSSLFLICARRIFSSKRKRKLFCWVLLSMSRAAGLASIFFKNTAEFPPHPPFRRVLAGTDGIFGGVIFLNPLLYLRLSNSSSQSIQIPFPA